MSSRGAAEESSFEDLPLSDRAREAVAAIGWQAPTPIQREVIPQLVMGRDVIGRAQTGSGKTAAFGLWLTDAVRAPGVQALVLAPTRELAVQVCEELNRLAHGAAFRAVAVHGGVPYDPQIAALRDPETTCVVATTGRLLDLLARKQADLMNVRCVVLDEADRMLDLGFLPEVERVLKLIPGSRQTALFTATMPKKVALLAHRYMAHAREIEVGAHTPETAEHRRVDVPSTLKLDAFLALVRQEAPRRALVFVRTREAAQRLADSLARAGVEASAFHGDLDQSQRERVVEGLRAGQLRLVVCTDVAARGLHLPDLTHVFNYDVPEEAETYVHRAGRTARAGKQGRVFTLVTENDGRHVEAAQRAAQVRLRPHEVVLDEGDGTVEAPRVLTRSVPLPPPPQMRGGYARGAKRKRDMPTPEETREARLAREAAREAARDDAQDGTSARGPEHALPPSRRRRRSRGDADDDE